MEAVKVDFQDKNKSLSPKKLKRRGKSSGDSWVMSFADMVTVLLCFFIIFYIIEKQYKKQVGFGENSGTVQKYAEKMEAPDVLELVETMKLLPQAIVVDKAQFLEVHFPPEMFFRSGQTKLTAEGLAVFERIILPLSKIKKGYSLQIQGYSDSQAVLDKKSRWWKNNMELSIERSLEVYDYFIKEGINKNILSVTGFGSNRPLLNKRKALQRRITLKFEPIVEDL